MMKTTLDTYIKQLPKQILKICIFFVLETLIQTVSNNSNTANEEYWLRTEEMALS